MRVNINGTWKTITRGVININGTWKTITRGVINIAGTWKSLVFGTPSVAQQVEISQSTNGSYVTTLTGKNYYWTNFGSGQYYFQKSTNGGSSWSDIDNNIITNPSSGSFNTKTYIITSLTPNVANLYRFLVSVTSSGGLTETSTSSSTTVQAPRDITNLSSTGQTTTSIDLSWGNAGGYALSYEVYYRQTGTGAGYSLYNTTSSTSITVSSLTAATEYAFKIIPYTGTSGQGYSGNDSNILYQSTSTPPLPGDFVWDTFSISNLNTLNASWSSSNATSYYVDIYEYGGSSVSGYPKTNTNSTSDTIYNLKYSTYYRGLGYGKNAYGNGNTVYSNIISTGADPTPGNFSYSISATTPYPTYPTGLSISSSSNQFTASWTPGSYNSAYIVYLSGVVSATVYQGSSSITRSYSSSGTQYVSVDTYNSNTKATISWGSSSGANSYRVSYTLGGISTYQDYLSSGAGSVDVYTSGQQISVTSVVAYSGSSPTNGSFKAGSPSGTTTITPQQTSPQFGTMPQTSTYLTYTPPFTPPTATAPSNFTFYRFNYNLSRQGLNWGWNLSTLGGSYTSVQYYEYQISTTSSGSNIINSGTVAYNSSQNQYLLSSPAGTTSSSSNSSIGPFYTKMESPTVTPYSTSARYGRVRAIVRGTDGNNYNGTWTSWL